MKHLILILALFLTACDRQEPAPEERQLQHQNGITVNTQIKLFSHEQTENGFKLHLAPPDARQSNEVVIELRETPPIKSTNKITINGIDYWRAEAIYQGGSGGMETTYSLWRPLKNDRGIYIEHYVQSDVEATQDVIESIAAGVVFAQ